MIVKKNHVRYNRSVEQLLTGKVVKIIKDNSIIGQNSDFNNKNQEIDEKILLDIVFQSDGTIKINDWRDKKFRNLDYCFSYYRIYGAMRKNKCLNILRCGEYLEFKYQHEDDIQGKLHRAFFCKDRLCPMCAWRRTLKIYAQASAVMNEAVRQGYKFVFLTLTIKNVKSNELDNSIKKMNDGFAKMRRRKIFSTPVKGFFKALEITYNQKTDEYHPHFHIILAVKPSYFKSRFYIKQEDFADLWKDVMDLDYTPVVDVRAFKAATKKELAKSTAEVAKYTVKDSEFLIRNKDGEVNKKRTDKVVYTLVEALHGKRLIAWGGVLKDIHKMLNLDDAEDGDLVITDQEDEVGGYTIIKRYRWGVGVSGEMNYYLSEVEQTEK